MPVFSVAQPMIERGKRHAVEFERVSNHGLLPTLKGISGFVGEQ
jgi:hypothetical protein